MAGQFEMAHAKDVVGAGIIAGGPYGCSESLFADIIPGPRQRAAQSHQGHQWLHAERAAGVRRAEPQATRRARRAPCRARAHRPDRRREDGPHLSVLRHERHDRGSGHRRSRAQILRGRGRTHSQVLFVSNIPAAHAFVTDVRGPECDHAGKPYIVDCDYDQAGALLGQIYGTLNKPAAKTTGHFQVFDQEAFTEGLSNHGLSDDGVVYVPEACRTNGGCRVHIAFHGCGQNRTFVGDAFARDSGYARWADTNNIIVLFPQTAADAAQSARLLGLVGLHRA